MRADGLETSAIIPAALPQLAVPHYALRSLHDWLQTPEMHAMVFAVLYRFAKRKHFCANKQLKGNQWNINECSAAVGDACAASPATTLEAANLLVLVCESAERLGVRETDVDDPNDSGLFVFLCKKKTKTKNVYLPSLL